MGWRLVTWASRFMWTSKVTWVPGTRVSLAATSASRSMRESGRAGGGEGKSVMVARGQKVFHWGQVLGWRRAARQVAGEAAMVVEQATVKEPPGSWAGVGRVDERTALSVFEGRSSGKGDGGTEFESDMLGARDMFKVLV